MPEKKEFHTDADKEFVKNFIRRGYLANVFLFFACLLFPGAYILHVFQLHWLLVVLAIGAGVYMTLMSLHSNMICWSFYRLLVNRRWFMEE